MNNKILLVSNMYPSKKYQSYGVFVKNFKEAMESHGVKFSSLVTINGRTENICIKFMNYIRLYFRFINNAIFRKYDIVYIHYFGLYSVVFIVILKLLKKRIVLNIHGTDLLGVNRFTRYLQHRVIRYVQLVVVPSSYYKNCLKDIFPYVNFNSIYIYPSGGINSKVFCQREKLDILKNYELENKFTIGYVSHINNDKGWKEFLVAVEQFKNCVCQDTQVIVIGTGQDEEEYTQFVKQTTLNNGIRRYGKLSQTKVADIFNAMDIFVFPTKRAAESLGLVGLEAMACGLPVIGTEVGALPTYIKNNYNGFLVKPGSAEAIYEKLKQYYFMQDDKKEFLVKNALLTALNFDSHKVTDRLIRELENIGQ
jgi:glycosyltransferase involved in cell wall biosynthesis